MGTYTVSHLSDPFQTATFFEVGCSCCQGIAARESSLHDPVARMQASPASSEAVDCGFSVKGRGINVFASTFEPTVKVEGLGETLDVGPRFLIP